MKNSKYILDFTNYEDEFAAFLLLKAIFPHWVDNIKDYGDTVLCVDFYDCAVSFVSRDGFYMRQGEVITDIRDFVKILADFIDKE